MNELDYFIKETLNCDPEPITISKVKRVICETFNVTMKEIEGKTRKQNIVFARQFYVFFLWQKGLMKTKLEIAKSLNKNHATIIYSINKLSNWVSLYDDMKSTAKTINNKLEFE